MYDDAHQRVTRLSPEWIIQFDSSEVEWFTIDVEISIWKWCFIAVIFAYTLSGRPWNCQYFLALNTQIHIHRNGNFVMMMKFSSIVATKQFDTSWMVTSTKKQIMQTSCNETLRFIYWHHQIYTAFYLMTCLQASICVLSTWIMKCHGQFNTSMRIIGGSLYGILL